MVFAFTFITVNKIIIMIVMYCINGLGFNCNGIFFILLDWCFYLILLQILPLEMAIVCRAAANGVSMKVSKDKQ